MKLEKFNLKIDGDYSKEKVVKKIVFAANKAIESGCRLSAWHWGITWDEKGYFRSSYVENDFTWGTILSTVIMFSDHIFTKPIEKNKAVAEILGVEYSWIQGFINGSSNKYTSVVNKLCQRKSIKGQQCRDGREIGKLLKLGYLIEDVIRLSYQPYDKIKYSTHDWMDIDQNKILLSYGVNQQVKVYQCKNCQMFGSSYIEPSNKKLVFYISKSLIGNFYYRSIDSFNYTCTDVMIKNILE